MRALVAAGRLLRLVPHVLHGLWIVRRRFELLSGTERHQMIQWWSLKTLRILGIRLQVQGSALPDGHLLVANHISWLDIMLVHAACPEARFVSKAEVRHWPLVGRLVDAAGTLYIQRDRKRDALRVVHQSAQALQAGDTVAVFPEGTTGAGHELLPFHANLLQAAVATATPVQPVALRYADRHHAVSEAAQWVGDTTLVQSLWRLACADGLQAHVQVLPARATAHADRRGLAETVRMDIVAALAALDQAPPP